MMLEIEFFSGSTNVNLEFELRVENILMYDLLFYSLPLSFYVYMPLDI